MNTVAEVVIQAEDFSVDAENRQLLDTHASGAVVNFIGVVRQNAAANLSSMEIEHYPGMTENSILEVILLAKKQWSVEAVKVIHRVGKLLPGEQIVYVGVAAGHRQTAFDSCAFIMDFLKTRAPFWKKEAFTSGEQRWVESRETDVLAAEKWNVHSSN